VAEPAGTGQGGHLGDGAGELMIPDVCRVGIVLGQLHAVAGPIELFIAGGHSCGTGWSVTVMLSISGGAKRRSSEIAIRLCD
jgi:hypothetical protein